MSALTHNISMQIYICILYNYHSLTLTLTLTLTFIRTHIRTYTHSSFSHIPTILHKQIYHQSLRCMSFRLHLIWKYS